MSKLADFLSELKRRRVFRVAAVYAGVAFIISEIVANTFDYLQIPDWVGTTIIVLLIIGFLVAVGMAWAFDITNEGIVRAKGRPAAAKRKTQPLLGNKSLAVIAVLAIIVAVWALLRGPSPGGAYVRSIAVLPPDDLISDPEQEFFTEGMHEAMVRELSGISAITVISRQSTLQYKDSEKTMPVIAAELDVDALIESSAQLEGERVRITVQLIDSQDRHLWRNSYDRNLEDVFALYDDVTRAIVQEIRATLTPEEEARLASAPQVNPEALELYNRGWDQRFLMNNRTKALEYLEQAVAIDSTFAPIWAAIAICYLFDPRTFEALDRALDLDPDNVLALTWQGVLQYMYMREGAIRNFAGAEASFRRALELEPSNAYARYEYGLFLQRWGLPSEGLAEMQLAHELDRYSALPLEGLAMIYASTRQYDKVLEHAQAWLEIAPGNSAILNRINDSENGILLQQGRYAEASAKAEELGELWIQLRAEWALGNTEKIYAIRDSMVSVGSWPQQEQDNPFLYARYYSILKQKDKALDLLELTFIDVNASGMNLYYNPAFDFLRAEPRYKVLTQRIAANSPGWEWPELFDENGNFIQPLDGTLEAYNAPGSR